MPPLFACNLCREFPDQILNQSRPTRRTGAMTWRPDPEHNRANSHLRIALSDLAKAAHARDLVLLGQPEFLEQLDSVEALIFDLERRRQIRIERLLEYLSRGTAEELGRVKDLSRQLEAEADIGDSLSFPLLATQSHCEVGSRLIVAMLRMIAGELGKAITTIHCAPSDVTQNPVLHLELLYADLEAIQRATVFDSVSDTIAKQSALLDRVRSYSRAVPLEQQEPILQDVLLLLGDSHHRRNLLGDPTARDKVLTEALRLAQQHCEHRPLCPRVARIRAEAASKSSDMQDCFDYHESLEFAASAWDTAIIRGATLPSDYCSASRAFLEWAKVLYHPEPGHYRRERRRVYAQRALDLAACAYRALPTDLVVTSQLGKCLTSDCTRWDLKPNALLSIARQELLIENITTSFQSIAQVPAYRTAANHRLAQFLRDAARKVSEPDFHEPRMDAAYSLMKQSLRISNQLRREYADSTLMIAEHAKSLRKLASLALTHSKRSQTPKSERCLQAAIRITSAVASRQLRSRRMDLALFDAYEAWRQRSYHHEDREAFGPITREQAELESTMRRLREDAQHPSDHLGFVHSVKNLKDTVSWLESLHAQYPASLETASLIETICDDWLPGWLQDDSNPLRPPFKHDDGLILRKIIAIWRSNLERSFAEYGHLLVHRQQTIRALKASCVAEACIDDPASHLRTIADFQHLLAVLSSMVRDPKALQVDSWLDNPLGPELAWSWTDTASDLGKVLSKRYQAFLVREFSSIELKPRNAVRLAHSLSQFLGAISRESQTRWNKWLWSQIAPVVQKFVTDALDQRLQLTPDVWQRMFMARILVTHRRLSDRYEIGAFCVGSLSTLEARLQEMLGESLLEKELQATASELLRTIVTTRLRKLQGMKSPGLESAGHKLWELLVDARTKHPESGSIADTFAEAGAAVIRQCMPAQEEAFLRLLTSALESSHQPKLFMSPRSAFCDRDEPALRIDSGRIRCTEEALQFQGYEHRTKKAIESEIALVTLHPDTRWGGFRAEMELANVWHELANWTRDYAVTNEPGDEMTALRKAIDYNVAILTRFEHAVSPAARRATWGAIAFLAENVGRLLMSGEHAALEDLSNINQRVIRYLHAYSQSEVFSENVESLLYKCLWMQTWMENQLSSGRATEWGKRTVDQIAEMRKKGIAFSEEQIESHAGLAVWIAGLDAEFGPSTE